MASMVITPPSWPSEQADRPEQTDLARPLQDRERQGVHDAQDGDHDTEEEQDVEQVEHGVDGSALLGRELGTVLDRDLR